LRFDIEVIKKYDKPGPRYTSYPTAPQFNEGYTHKHYLADIQATNKESDQNISLYFHLPYCDTLCYFCGCNMIITRNRPRVATYVDYIKKEINLIRALVSPGRKVSQLHWGGGTPTHLSPAEIDELAGYIRKNFEFTPEAENSCEIDPRELKREHLEALRRNGFNRLSMGVQDFEERVQKAVNRIQPENITMDAIRWAKELEFSSINIDLMYGLPFQTVETFTKTVDKIIDIYPDRIAVFNYAHVPWMKKHMELIKTDELPTPDVKLNILKMTTDKLTGAGYAFIGMDHFAKPTDDLTIAMNEKKMYRNFQGYSTHSDTDLYALGISSISQIGSSYAQNYKTEREYYEAIDLGILPTQKGYQMTEEDILRKDVIMKIMSDFELNFSEIEKRYNINFEQYFAWGLSQLDEMEADGLILRSPGKIEITEFGRLLVRNVAMNFDGYIEKKLDKAKYSRTV
jgi:oxygen-independent coproporphyrinogen III oxidase